MAKAAVIIMSGAACSPAPKIIGIGRRTMLNETFSPENNAAKIKIIIPIKVNMKPKMNIFMSGLRR